MISRINQAEVVHQTNNLSNMRNVNGGGVGVHTEDEDDEDEMMEEEEDLPAMSPTEHDTSGEDGWGSRKRESFENGGLIGSGGGDLSDVSVTAAQVGFHSDNTDTIA